MGDLVEFAGEHALFQVADAVLAGDGASEVDEAAQDLHTRVKSAWDPDNILNPGKSLPRW